MQDFLPSFLSINLRRCQYLDYIVSNSVIIDDKCKASGTEQSCPVADLKGMKYTTKTVVSTVSVSQPVFEPNMFQICTSLEH